MNFANFLRTPFLENNSGGLLVKSRHCKNEARNMDCLCCRKVDAIPTAWGKNLAIQLLWVSARLLVTCASLNYLLHEFFFGSWCSWRKILSDAPIDALCVDETKLDSSFPDHQFKNDGTSFHHSGEIVTQRVGGN